MNAIYVLSDIYMYETETLKGLRKEFFVLSSKAFDIDSRMKGTKFHFVKKCVSKIFGAIAKRMK